MTIRYKLPPSLDFERAILFHRWLNENRAADIVLDGSDVKKVGALAGQCILVALAEWERRGLDVSFENASQSFLAGLNSIGIEAARLGLEEIGQC